MNTHNRLLVAIKDTQQNKVIKADEEDNIELSFNTEYAIVMKNLDTRRACVSVSIDGRDALSRVQLVVEPNKETELERFLDASGFRSGNRFKFIEKTRGISDYRGDRLDDSIIRIEYRFERFKTIGINAYPSPYRWVPFSYQLIPRYDQCYYYSGTTCDEELVDNSTLTANISNRCRSINEVSDKHIDNSGITVEGSISNQRFDFVKIGRVEDNSYVIILRLCGVKPISSKLPSIRYKKPNIQLNISKQFIICSTCGCRFSSTIIDQYNGHAFCANCGTYLHH